MNRQTTRCLPGAIGGLLLSLGLGGTAHAIELGDKIELYGMGYQGYLRTNTSENTYLKADNHGTWDYNQISLLLVGKLGERSKVWIKTDSTSDKTRIDWAFVDYQATPELTLRAGQIKMPWGLYAQTLDNKYLQLSTLPPLMYQLEASDIVEKAYRGVGLVYDRDMGQAGSLSFDLYAGQVLDPNAEATTKFHRLWGTRLTWNTPIDGLRFMASGFMTNLEEIDVAALGATNKKVGSLSVDYKADNWDIKAESARMLEFANAAECFSSYYVQVGYTFAEKWTPFFRYDYFLNDVTRRHDPDQYQKSKVVGIDYRFNKNVGVRVENHFNRGYVMPVLSGQLGEDDAPVRGDRATKDRWNMLAASVYFMF